MNDWPRGGYPAGDTPVSDLKPPPPALRGQAAEIELAEVDPAVSPAVPRVFHLVRYDDPSGVSGVGIVAQGMQARDGAVALRWCVPGMPATWNLFDSIDDVLTLNGHSGLTVVKWVDGGE